MKKKPTKTTTPTGMCGDPARQGPRLAPRGKPCGLDTGHIARGERHSNGQFTWPLRGKDAQTARNAKISAEAAAPAKAKEPTMDAEQSLSRAHRKKHAEARADAKAKATPKTAPVSKFCGDKEPGSMFVCSLSPGHDGDHTSGNAKTWPRAKAPSLADACPKCGHELGEHAGKKCPPKTKAGVKFDDVWKALSEEGACDAIGGAEYERVRAAWNRAGGDIESFIRREANVVPDDAAEPVAEGAEDGRARWACEEPFTGDDGSHRRCEGRNEHNGPHYAYSEALRRTVHAIPEPNVVPRAQDDEEDPEGYETRTDDDRELARQQREAREAHEREIEGFGPKIERNVREALGIPDEPSPTSRPTTSSPAPAAIGNTITCRGKVYPVHPAARIFPTPEAQYREVVESIRTQGLLHDVERLNDPENGNPVIDGCSRLRACDELGIDPRFKFINVDNPYKHVIAVNLARRHLDESQRAMAAAELTTMEHGANQHSRTGNAAGPPTQAEAAQLVGVSERLVRDAARVKREAVPEVAAAVREGKLKVSAGAELAKLGPKQQREILGKVTKGKGEVKGGKVRALVKQEEKRAIVRKINTGRVAALPIGEFGVILADYPWKYDNSDQHDGSRGHMGYPPMEMDEIIAHAREAAKRASKNCIIALWTTNLYIPRMAAVIEAYGAEHHTVFTWPKPRAGVGTWGRGQTEHVVISSIGAPVHTLNEVSTLLPSWKPAHPDEHSSKPAEVAALLAKHCGGPFLELFAREERAGWTVWGAETDKFSSEAA